MGLLGVAFGIITTAVGVITDDEELAKKGTKRMAIGATTLVIGDVLGISDTAGELILESTDV